MPRLPVGRPEGTLQQRPEGGSISKWRGVRVKVWHGRPDSTLVTCRGAQTWAVLAGFRAQIVPPPTSASPEQPQSIAAWSWWDGHALNEAQIHGLGSGGVLRERFGCTEVWASPRAPAQGHHAHWHQQPEHQRGARPCAQHEGAGRDKDERARRGSDPPCATVRAGNRLIKGCRDTVRSARGRQVVDHGVNKVVQHDKLVLVGELLWLSRVVDTAAACERRHTH